MDVYIANWSDAYTYVPAEVDDKNSQSQFPWRYQRRKVSVANDGRLKSRVNTTSLTAFMLCKRQHESNKSALIFSVFENRLRAGLV